MKLKKELTTITPLSKCLAMIFFILFPFIGFYLGMKYQQMITISNPIRGKQTTATSLTPMIHISLRDKDQVFYAKNNGKIMIFNDGLYFLEGQQLTSYPNAYSIQWMPLIHAPQGVQEDNFRQVYSMKQWSSPIYDFGFVMRWDSNHYYVYLHPVNPVNQLIPISSFTWSLNTMEKNEANVPEIDSLSPDGQYLSLNMYGCANCGAAAIKADTLLLNIATHKMKRIGDTIFFMWDKNGTYTYKPYKALPCADTTEGNECPADQSMPLQSGSL